MKKVLSLSDQDMNHVSRRNFVKKSIHITSGAVALGNAPGLMSALLINKRVTDPYKVIIPMPLQVVIDDVGWWSGEDGSKKQEPYRTGISRNHVPADYLAIVELGRALGIRPQAAMILCEWDKNNILRQLPSSTWMGDKWDNSKWVGPWLEEAADIIRNNQEHIELTLHGIGHEYWENGTFTRAEWTDSNGKMRPRDQVEKHLDYFGILMDQHKLGSFPVSFVPAAFRHCFGRSEGSDISLAEILKKRGINYINTPLKIMFNNENVKNDLFCIDGGVMTVDRGEDQFPWLIFPADPKAELKGPTCGMHWPNLLHPDPGKNSEIVERWVNYLRAYNEKPDMILARNSETFQEQLLHRDLTKVKLTDNSVELDFTVTDKLPVHISKNELVLKIQSVKPLTFNSSDLKVSSGPIIRKEGFIYNLNIERKNTRARSVIQVSEI
jgi:hypothetical protein